MEPVTFLVKEESLFAFLEKYLIDRMQRKDFRSDDSPMKDTMYLSKSVLEVLGESRTITIELNEYTNKQGKELETKSVYGVFDHDDISVKVQLTGYHTKRAK